MDATLEPDERARGAGVENGNAHFGTRRINPLPQLTVAQAFTAKEQALFIRVAGVVDENFAAQLRPGLARDAFLELGKGLGQAGARGVANHDKVVFAHAAQAGEHAAHRFTVRVGETQAGAARSAVVGRGNQRETSDGGRVGGLTCLGLCGGN